VPSGTYKRVPRVSDDKTDVGLSVKATVNFLSLPLQRQNSYTVVSWMPGTGEDTPSQLHGTQRSQMLDCG
jgi:hypothetical protein